MSKLSKAVLQALYEDKKISVSVIAKLFGCSQNRINYWLKKYKIEKRSISEAVYAKHNPKGDPFSVRKPTNMRSSFLFGLGLGLYWGEGTKSNKLSIRLGNTNPKLIKKFLEFLFEIYGIRIEKLKFGLQIFSDLDPLKAKTFWLKELGLRSSQFQKVIVTPSRGAGTYRSKIQHGVLTVYYHNRKLRDIICAELENL